MATPLNTENTETKRKYNTKLRQGVSGLMQSGEDERFVRFVAYREGYDPEEIDNELNLYKRMASGMGLTEEKDTSEVGAAATKKLQESVTSRTALIKNLQSYKSLIDSHGFESGIGKDSGKILGEMQNLRAEITANYKKAEALGALDVGVQKLVSGIIGQEPKLGFSDENEGLEFPTLNIGGWKSERASAALESAIKNAQSTLDTDVATLKSGFDLNRDSQTTQPIQPDNEDKAAFDWMRNNPNHPEYERVKSQIESRFGTSNLSVLSGTLNPETSQDTPLVNPETNEIKSSGFFETISPEEKAKNLEKNLANAKAQEIQAKSESDYANSFKGFMNNFLGDLGENTGMKKFGQGIGSALFLNSQAGKELQDKAVAGDKYALETLNQILAEAPNTKELLGEAALTALNALSGGLASKTASQIPKVSGLASKIIKGGSAGYAYDVASNAEENKPTGEVFKPGLGTVIGASAPAVLKVNDVLKARKALNLSTEAETAVGQIVQGKTRDVEPALETLMRVDKKGVNNYQDLSGRINNNTKTLGQTMDEVLSQDHTLRKLGELKKVSIVGNTEVKTNYVSQALGQLEELYVKTNEPENAQRIKNLITKAKKEGLTLLDINKIAQEHGTEFKKKAFNKKSGEALTSVNAENFENTRKGVKESFRRLLPEEVRDKAIAIDKKLSQNLTTQRLVDTMIEKVNALEQKVNKRSMLQKTGRFAGQVADTLTGGIVKSFFSKFLVESNLGLKSMNSLDLQSALKSNLKKIDKLDQALNGKTTVIDTATRELLKILTKEYSLKDVAGKAKNIRPGLNTEDVIDQKAKRKNKTIISRR